MFDNISVLHSRQYLIYFQVAVVTFSNNGTVQIPLTNSDVIDINPTTVPQDAQLTNIVEGIEVALDEVFSDE